MQTECNERMKHRNEWWVEVQWSNKGIKEERVRKQQEQLREREREREMEWSALVLRQLQWQSHSSLASLFTVYMSTLAARQLQRSVIIIYLFRMPRGEGYGAVQSCWLSVPAALCSVVQWHIILNMAMEIAEVKNKLCSIWRCNVAYSRLNAIYHMLGT